MRYVLAILALAISGVLLLLGIGQRSFLAGPVEIVHTVAADEGANYAVIDGGEFVKVPGQANIIMQGEDAFLAIAKTRDIEGWVAPFGYERLTLVPDTREMERETVRPVAPVSELLETDESGNPVPLDPRGSDLWLEARSSEDTQFRMPIELSENQSVLLAGTGEEPLPGGASIVWVQDRATPWAGPLFAAGAAFALLGALLYLIAFDRDKRALGPRRGRRGPLIGVQNVVRGVSLRRSSKGEPSPQKGALSSLPDEHEAVAEQQEALLGENDSHATDNSSEVITGVIEAIPGETKQSPNEENGENHAK